MKKWLIRIVVGTLLIVVVVLTSAFVLDKIDRTMIVKYIKSEHLITVRPDWPGTPVDEKGRFVNAEHPFLPKTADLLKWQLSGNPFKQAKRDDAERLPVLDPAEFLASEKDGILWLGHASVYLRLGGKTVLIDPVFDEPSLVRRFVAVPNPLEKIKRVDYVLVTHDHRDHCDETTLKAIARKFPDAKFLGGLEMQDLFADGVNETDRIKNAGWYERFDLGDDALEITFVPVRHWSRRGLADTNKRLWGGYLISGGGKSIISSSASGRTSRAGSWRPTTIIRPTLFRRFSTRKRTIWCRCITALSTFRTNLRTSRCGF